MRYTITLLQSSYCLAREEMEIDAVSEFNSPLTQPEKKCQNYAAVAEERLYD
jgi:hypothetical protein